MAGDAEDDETMIRGMYGPDVTFLGVPRAELDALDGLDVVFLGAPFDSGTSYRSGARFGPQAIRATDYLPHDASRPHLALGVDPLAELRDRRRRRRAHAAGRDGGVAAAAGGRRAGRGVGRRDTGDPGRRPHRHPARRHRGGQARGLGPGVADPLRRARGHRGQPVRLAVRARHADAAADRVGRGARRQVPADRAARVLAGAADAGLDGRAADALVRDERDRHPRARRMPGRGARHRRRRVRRRLLVRGRRRGRPGHGPGHRHAGTRRPHRPGSCSTRCGGSPCRCRWPGSTWWRSRRRTTTPR